MVGLVADNGKLRARAAGTVGESAGVGPEAAGAAPAAAGETLDRALALLKDAGNDLRAALARRANGG